ncbi:lipoprotein signal peptidase [Beutenbergia cavernae DSM 12333]|uniref:Lipoprotein signal peptidase n=1 Tax=Beutenbergia cavernae (strain ATCC BAA-8 / DSM 12333 / CCUG 43141 / JCM 11478 / NBRC 16432 / NCIMB 13614 / HKI 0122) TaxID=471853 RepID=C5BW51_BEUC1|nr:signal peptidase II [Beutenbergia cavernae]ACQ80652.1 lipoprotein signal peptidase [Beutenbergia cavernae DSM 12333]
MTSQEPVGQHDATHGPAAEGEAVEASARAGDADATPSESSGAPPVPPERRRRLLWQFAVLAVAVVLVDQVTKYLAVTNLEPGERVPVIGDLLSFTLVFNPGAAFSFGTGVTWVFTIAMVAVSIAVLVTARKIGTARWAVALGALLGGAVGNLIDRLFREPGFGVGHVVDFINYADLFVGNVADIAIVLSAAGIALLAVQGRALDGSRVQHADG